MTAQKFDIRAKLPEGALPGQAPEMLRTLLAERFKLAFHREIKEQTVLALDFAAEDVRMASVVAGVALPGASAEEPGTSTVRASLDRLGLKLESRKLPADLVVIDHLEKNPTTN